MVWRPPTYCQTMTEFTEDSLGIQWTQPLMLDAWATHVQFEHAQIISKPLFPDSVGSACVLIRFEILQHSLTVWVKTVFDISHDAHLTSIITVRHPLQDSLRCCCVVTSS